MTTHRAPAGLSAGGRALWVSVVETHDLDALQAVQLAEACRAKDRLDRLDAVLRGDAETWMRLTHRTQTDDYELKIDGALASANVTANTMKQLLAALRLPDADSGKRPQQRGGARGAYTPKALTPTGTVSSLDRAREAKSS